MGILFSCYNNEILEECKNGNFNKVKYFYEKGYYIDKQAIKYASLFGNFKNSAMEMFEKAKNYFLHLASLIGKTIDDFVASIASWIGGWTPPLICFGVPINVET